MPGGSIQNKTLFFGVLDWGLGHVTRSIPLIKQLLQQHNRVILGGSGSSGDFLRQYFPSLRYFELPAYNPQYPGKNMYWNMARQYRHFKNIIRDENILLQQKLIQEVKPDLIISDNRYGLYSTGLESIFITHQLFIRAGILSGVINSRNHAYIRKFSRCLVPDFADAQTSLSGQLSHGKRLSFKVEYMGPLTRFAGTEPDFSLPEYKTVALLSGPEPQRSYFEKTVMQQLSNYSVPVAVVCGIPHKTGSVSYKNHITCYPHLPDAQLAGILLRAEKIICRPGYSTLMDLHYLKKLHSAEFHPTPGQTEQAYLKKWITRKMNTAL